jgi:hypothetical protein
MTLKLQNPGTFTLGCNYWASHAGTRMWSDWRPDVVDRDFADMAAAGITALRIFPLWSDFQPVTVARGWGGQLKELRFGEEPLPDTPVGQAGVSEVMLGRFAEFCALARKHRLDLIVGLITGWMSGRTYCPPVLEGRVLHTDPLALQLQGRFIRIFVERFRSEPAVAAWDLGNECNCLGPVPSREAAWTWTAFITSHIRASDATRPVVSGMHSLEPNTTWAIQDQGELCDLLTTHPYPLWSKHTSQDPLDTIRTTLHATAESRMYADIGGKPCFAEEIGTMGPMMGDWTAASHFVRTNLFSLWANDCRAFMWWCAYDQRELPNAPYDWVAVERELGLWREDRSAKPMLAELQAFSALLPALPSPLPERRIDAVCLLSRGQDAWGAAYSSFVLATQAKLSLRFAWIDDAIPDAQLYLVPSLAGHEGPYRRRWHELLAKVHAGARLWLSLDDGVVEPFGEVFGVRVRSRGKRFAPTTFDFAGQRLTATRGLDLKLVAEPGTTVLAAAADGSAILTRRAYGTGDVTLCAFPVEAQLTATPGGFHAPGAEPLHLLYRDLTAATVRPFDSTSAAVAITIHPTVSGSTAGAGYAVLINHGDTPAQITAAAGVRIVRWLHGAAEISGHQAAVVEFTG